MITCEDSESITVIRMEHGKVNALDLEFCDALEASFADADKSSCKAVVLTGSGKTFSAGVNLLRLLESDTEYVREFVPKLVRIMEQMFVFPKPVVVALNGNAIAGGCIIACAGDSRIGAQGEGKMGVPELLVGVPFPPIALEIMRFAATHRYFQEIMYLGRYYNMEDALHRGLIDEIVPSDQLMPKAIEMATKLSEVPAEAFRLVKLQMRTPYLKNAEQAQASLTDEILKVWCSLETRAVIREYLRRTIGK